MSQERAGLWTEDAPSRGCTAHPAGAPVQAMEPGASGVGVGVGVRCVVSGSWCRWGTCLNSWGCVGVTERGQAFLGELLWGLCPLTELVTWLAPNMCTRRPFSQEVQPQAGTRPR